MSRVVAHAPAVAKAVARYSGALLYQSSKLLRRLIELVGLRVAFHNQCRTRMAARYQSAISDGLTEDLVCSLVSRRFSR
jgi:alkylhydroperoxidase family enzyme